MHELFEHTADLGLRVSAATLEELLADAARGLLAMLVTNQSDVLPLHERHITVEAQDPAYLLFDWLSELLYVFETERLLFAEFEIHVETDDQGRRLGLNARCRGEPMDKTRHQMDHEVKAITYHGLAVQETPTGWQAQVIVDI